ncbi:MAG: FMN-binding protein [Faecalicoccus sp.]|nr:FMN-binding protein [Faecalicoccus sp.]
MKRQIIKLFTCFSIFTFTLCGCSSSASYKDGVYEGKSEMHENLDEDGADAGNGYGVVTITIKDGAITDCEFKTYEPDGTLKDENYGKKEGDVANRDYYNKAQKALAACDQYAQMLVENGSLDGIDAISGASINYDEFVEAVTAALNQAKEK